MWGRGQRRSLRWRTGSVCRYAVRSRVGGSIPRRCTFFFRNMLSHTASPDLVPSSSLLARRGRQQAMKMKQATKIKQGSVYRWGINHLWWPTAQKHREHRLGKGRKKNLKKAKKPRQTLKTIHTQPIPNQSIKPRQKLERMVQEMRSKYERLERKSNINTKAKQKKGGTKTEGRPWAAEVVAVEKGFRLLARKMKVILSLGGGFGRWRSWPWVIGSAYWQDTIDESNFCSEAPTHTHTHPTSVLLHRTMWGEADGLTASLLFFCRRRLCSTLLVRSCCCC